MHQFLIAR